MPNYNLDDYVPVSERIEKFYTKYPEGSLSTELVSFENGMVLMKAFAYKNKEDICPCTGHAMEKEGEGYVNKTSVVENCETSAVGRALANMGFEIKKGIASREEMEKVQRMEQAKNKPVAKPVAKPEVKGKETITKLKEEVAKEIKEHPIVKMDGPASTPFAKTITKPQALALIDLARKAGFTDSLIKTVVQQEFSVGKSTDIPISLYDEAKKILTTEEGFLEMMDKYMVV